jgi:glycine cleavage system H protein
VSAKKWLRRRWRNRPRLKITGVSTPLGGLQVAYSESDRELIRRLLIFLEDRIIFAPGALEASPERLISSMRKIGDEVTKVLQALPETSPAVRPLRRIRADLDFGHRNWRPEDVGYLVGNFRGVVGSQLAALADPYDLKLEPPLAGLLPFEDREAARRASEERLRAQYLKERQERFGLPSPKLRVEEAYPADLRYHTEHSWVRLDGDEATIGLTWYAVDALGDIVHLELPELRSEIIDGQPYGDVESVKAVSDLTAPLSGTVVEVNEGVFDFPDVVNEDPYGVGWLIRIVAKDMSKVDVLLSPSAYRALLGTL